MPMTPLLGSHYFPSEATKEKLRDPMSCPEFPKEIMAEAGPKSGLCPEPCCPLPSPVSPLVNFLAGLHREVASPHSLPEREGESKTLTPLRFYLKAPLIHHRSVR